MTEFIRCTALTRIVFGSKHWRVAKAHSDLAAAYFDLKGWFVKLNANWIECYLDWEETRIFTGYAPQAEQHAEVARGIIRSAEMAFAPSEKLKIFEVIISIHYTLGRAHAQQKKYPLHQPVTRHYTCINSVFLSSDYFVFIKSIFSWPWLWFTFDAANESLLKAEELNQQRSRIEGAKRSESDEWELKISIAIAKCENIFFKWANTF